VKREARGRGPVVRGQGKRQKGKCEITVQKAKLEGKMQRLDKHGVFFVVFCHEGAKARSFWLAWWTRQALL